ncbi:MAG: ergothioneine biosynthesis protein EgtB [Candidatus Omnitrophica bacterium]|nr:ergothioneine biosynthesis protein EgtB [Candidatus Omnitrophota bacterium]
MSVETQLPTMRERFMAVRRLSEELCKHLAAEDFVVQTMPDVSPAKWHLAHTTWFFETFLLKKFIAGYRDYHPRYSYIFNSYYNAVGDRHCRANRGQLSRPTVAEVFEYRHAVNERMQALLEDPDPAAADEISALIELGLHHEQQHQELMITDLKHVFACSPLHPVYWNCAILYAQSTPPLRYTRFPESVQAIGHDGNGFGYDNEFPRHDKIVPAFQIGSRLITNGEYIEFITDGGYERPELWLSDGWSAVRQQQWRAPLYWDLEGNDWHYFTLNGYVKVNPYVPVCHVSFYEADAFARWKGKRLPSEEEWEVAFRNEEIAGNFVDRRYFHPVALDACSPESSQAYGDVWEWTSSPYVGYPGYRPAAGAVGEYNGKFMCNQKVLRGGSCATSQSHIRPTYRNFFYPDQRWQFMGIRLADDGLEL